MQVSENVKLVSEIRDVFSTLQDSPVEQIRNPLQSGINSSACLVTLSLSFSHYVCVCMRRLVCACAYMKQVYDFPSCDTEIRTLTPGYPFFFLSLFLRQVYLLKVWLQGLLLIAYII